MMKGKSVNILEILKRKYPEDEDIKIKYLIKYKKRVNYSIT